MTPRTTGWVPALAALLDRALDDCNKALRLRSIDAALAQQPAVAARAAKFGLTP